MTLLSRCADCCAPIKKTVTRLSQEVKMTKGYQAERRSFLRAGAIAGAALAAGASGAFAEEVASKSPIQGDFDILRFLAAAEILETDLWEQYNELGGIQDAEVPGGSGNPGYTAALAVLDSEMA